MPTDAGTEPEPKRPLLDRPLGRIAMFLAVILVAILALNTCAAHDEEISFEEAEEIARNEVDFVPDKVLVRGVQRGLDAHLYWAVSLSTTNAAGLTENCATVLVDAETGAAEKQLC